MAMAFHANAFHWHPWHGFDPLANAAHATGQALARVWRWLVTRIEVWHDRALTRRQLAEMDDRLLKDIGLTRLDAEQEYTKPFWRP